MMSHFHLALAFFFLTPVIVAGNSANAQTPSDRCPADSDSCQNRIDRLVEQSYQNYRTPQRITGKRLNTVTTTCNNLPSTCTNSTQQQAETLQNSEVLREIRRIDRTNLENTLQR